MNDGRSALTQALILTRPTDASVEPNLPIEVERKQVKSLKHRKHW